MQGGELRHIISILQAPIISGPAGNQEDWDNPIVVCYQYASIKPASASDVIRAGQTVTQVETPIEIRYYPGILPNMRVQHNSDVYVIRGILNEEERNRKLTLMCIGLGQNE